MKRIKLSKGNTFRIAQELFVSVSIRQKRAPSGGIKKLLASLGSAKLAIHKAGRIATFSEGANPLVAVKVPRGHGSQRGAA